MTLTANSLNTNLCTHNDSNGEWWSSCTVYQKDLNSCLCVTPAILICLPCPHQSPIILALIMHHHLHLLTLNAHFRQFLLPFILIPRPSLREYMPKAIH